MRCIPFLLIALAQQAHARPLRIVGTIGNVKEIGIRSDYHCLNVQAVGDGIGLGFQVDATTGVFAGELEAPLVRAAGGSWVDVHFVAVSAAAMPAFRTMTIRVPYARITDLGTFDWKPSHYRWKKGSLVIDTAVPRDTVIGALNDKHIRISPINPTPDDSVLVQFTLHNSGQPVVLSLGGFYMKDCCTILCDFTFAVRTDTDVYGDSWLHHVDRHWAPRLDPGRYRLRQVPAQGEHLRDVDFLLGSDIYFTVGERREP
jgi:hypothetical protein